VQLASDSLTSRATRVLDAVPPTAGAAVMGTGIVSVGLAHDGRYGLSDALLGIDVAFWLVLAAVFTARVLWQRRRFIEEARLPAGLTGVAGTAVLGARFALLGVHWALYVLTVLALCLWATLVSPVLRHWRTPTVGVSFMLVVATESLAVLIALIALQQRIAWLGAVALVPLVLGLAAYAYVLARFDRRQLVEGRGDHWIAGGALAIATLACARAAAAVDVAPSLGGLGNVLDDISLGLWAAAVVWLPVLIVGEISWPRLSYDIRRWSAVFPLGMYAVCSLAVGSVTGIGWLSGFGRVWIWVAFALWIVVLPATLVRAVTVARTQESGAPGPA
jgi:tellurite resistance protein TehA-like permease